jgi:hypothetical protein
MSALDRLPEAERNRLLRRLDWRFLLRQEDEPRMACLADGLLGRAASALWDEPAEGAAADLVVVSRPDRSSLAEAVGRLRPGGELYAEWSRPPFGGRRALRQLLEQAGLVDVRCYWSWPPPDRGAQFWLPLDSREALDHFLRPRRHGRRAVLVGLWQAAARLGLLAPLSAVARRPGGEPAGDEAAWLLLTGGRRSTNKVVAWRFEPPGPPTVVKLTRSAAEEEPLRREQRALELLAERRPDLPGVPRALAGLRRCGRIGLAETALPGRPLQGLLRRETLPELAASVTDWLVELARGTELQLRGQWWERLVGAPLEFLEERFVGAISTGEVDRARAILERLPDLPLVCEQRDCAPWNFLVDDDGAIGVLDWESSEPHGLPALDLLYFQTYAAFLVEGALASGRVREAYADLLDPATETGRVAHACESSYCERLGLDPSSLGPFRLLCWTIHARSNYAQLSADAAAPPSPEALRESFFLTLWREELRRQAP